MGDSKSEKGREEQGGEEKKKRGRSSFLFRIAHFFFLGLPRERKV